MGIRRGLVIDGEVTQKMIDRMVGKGFEYVVARGYKGITKRPLLHETPQNKTDFSPELHIYPVPAYSHLWK